jgi:hypothetical protein
VQARCFRSPGAPYRRLILEEEFAMRNALSTPFWRAAYQSLPREVRERYLAHFERAERWELGLDAAIEAVSRAKAAFARLFRAPGRPRSAH